MWRYPVGGLSAVALATAGTLWWKSSAIAGSGLPHPPSLLAGSAATQTGGSELPPQASDKTREERRFSRYDKDRDGKVAREEYLAARRKAFAKLDTNGDGKLGFEEWAAKAIGRFDGADTDKSGALTPTEFATTKPPRKAPRPTVDCLPTATGKDKDGDDT